MQIHKLLLPVLLLSLTAGCAADINYRNAIQYATAADSASKNGDWDQSRRYWAKAVVNGRLAHMPPNQRAIFNYEYGRALGVQCFWEESEKYLLNALQLDQQSNGPTYLALTELSRLKLDQGQYDKATHYFGRAIQALEAANAPKEAPMAFADILIEYSAALSETGRKKESQEALLRAENIKAQNVEGKSITERTPYGSKCVTN